jgi:Uma2 family endonuclease
VASRVVWQDLRERDALRFALSTGNCLEVAIFGMTALPAKHLFNVVDWRRLAELGFFSPEYRAELIAGEIIDMPPIGSTHSGCVDWLNQFLSRRLFGKAIVRIQNPLVLDDFSELQPDVVVARFREDFYRTAHPTADDALLVIEVADTTASYDRNTKGKLYAHAGIPEYWLVDLSKDCVEVYRNPQSRGYAEKRLFGRGRVLETVAGRRIRVDAAAILG